MLSTREHLIRGTFSFVAAAAFMTVAAENAEYALHRHRHDRFFVAGAAAAFACWESLKGDRPYRGIAGHRREQAHRRATLMSAKKHTVSLWLTSALEKEFGRYAGVDEVGLGCLAGPIFAAAVIIDNYDWPEVDQLGDSKTMGPRRRVILARRIKEECRWAVGRSEVSEIDTLGLRRAHALAIERAVSALSAQVGVPTVVIDGDAFDIDLGDLPVRFVRYGDALIPSVSAASIVAKVDRDAHMAELAQDFPMYGWESNAAYGTADHKAAMQKYGLTKHHRRSFKPVGRIAHELGDCCDGLQPACCFMFTTPSRNRHAASR